MSGAITKGKTIGQRTKEIAASLAALEVGDHEIFPRQEYQKLRWIKCAIQSKRFKHCTDLWDRKFYIRLCAPANIVVMARVE